MALFNKYKGNKMKKILMSALAISGLTIGANAACNNTGCWDVTVTKLFVVDDGKILVELDNAATLPTNCDPFAGKFLTLTNTEGQKAMYSLLLTAQTTKKKVSMKTGSGYGCKIQYTFIK